MAVNFIEFGILVFWVFGKFILPALGLGWLLWTGIRYLFIIHDNVEEHAEKSNPL